MGWRGGDGTRRAGGGLAGPSACQAHVPDFQLDGAVRGSLPQEPPSTGSDPNGAHVTERQQEPPSTLQQSQCGPQSGSHSPLTASPGWEAQRVQPPGPIARRWGRDANQALSSLRRWCPSHRPPPWASVPAFRKRALTVLVHKAAGG